MIFFHGILIFKGKNLTSQVRYIKVRNCFVVSRLWTINLSKEFFIWNSCNVYSYFCKKWAQKKGFIPFYACFTYTTFTESKPSESSLTIDLVVLKIRKNQWFQTPIAILSICIWKEHWFCLKTDSFYIQNRYQW